MCFRIIFIVIFICNFLSCAKEKGADPATLYTSPDFIVKFNNGQLSQQYQQTVSNVITDARSTFTGSEDFEICSFIKKDSKVGESFSISFSKIFYTTPSQYQTDSLFTYGSYYNFGPSTSDKVSIQVEHIDVAGLRWTSMAGVQQIGSKLQVTGYEVSAGPGFRYKVRGSFTCNLFNSQYNFKQYSGTFTGKFGAGNF